MALTDITATTGATVDSRLFARNGAVTLDNNTIDVTCIPEPSSFWPLAFLVSVVGGWWLAVSGRVAVQAGSLLKLARKPQMSRSL